MLKRKNARQRGKIKLSEYFQEFKDGDKVAIVRYHSLNPNFPKRIQGRVGIIVGKRGEAYKLIVQEGDMKKMHIMQPMHLKKLK